SADGATLPEGGCARPPGSLVRLTFQNWPASHERACDRGKARQDIRHIQHEHCEHVQPNEILPVPGFTLIELLVVIAIIAMWNVAVTTHLTDWTPLLSTNTSTSDWSVTDKESAAARFYRV